VLNLHLVLDPCISYSVLLDEFEGDEDLVPFLEEEKNELHIYYKTQYADNIKMSSYSSPSNKLSQTNATPNNFPQKNLTA
jgi:hypothetical protein